MRVERPRAVSSTRHSITVAWNAAPADDDDDDDDGGEVVYVLQMMDRISGWTTVYSGFKTEVEVTSLRPGDPFEFRVRRAGRESEWSESLFAATKDEATPAFHLFRAVRTGNHGNVRRIVAGRPQIANVPDKLGMSPMENAILRNDVAAVALLLGLGVDPRAPSVGSRRTPLMAAASRGHLDIVRVLHERGSSWEDKDRNGLTALHYAADNSHLEVVRYAVENGADVTGKDGFGWSPLTRAVILKSSAEVIEFLLDNGGEVNETDGNKQTPLMQAVLSGRADIVRLLLSRNADVGMRNAHGRTARDMAGFVAGKESERLSELLQRERT